MTTQDTELTRVKDLIKDFVLRFVTKRHKRLVPEFQMRELQEYVHTALGYVAPDSPSRILRQLRLEGKVKYSVINRRQSLYRIEGIN